ncbi:hypothetical protein LUZ60_015418 [Juncus effusus]|nr:hypothetical protein LUZ60_015418 [Juncus effusus]
MASTGEKGDLLWCLQNISSQIKPLQTISFFCSNSNSSSSYQESDFSLRINISTSSSSNDTQFFGQFLHHLAVQRDKYNDLTSLLFHGVEWKMDHISSLKSILMGSMKQIEFEKNMFSSEVLSELSEAIGRNTCLKAITFSECEIGCTGATLLASVLLKNDTVEELQIWEDSIGSKGAEELSKMIEVNHSIKLLTILDKNSIAAAPLIAAMLSRNRNLEMHVWGNSHKIVEFAPQPGTMKIYSLDHSSDLRRVVISLGWNTTVVTLDMTGVRLKTKWARDFRGVLESNMTLKDVKLSRTGLGNKGVVYIGAGLFKNKCVEKLSLDGNRFGSVGLEHLLCPLSCFTPLQNQPANYILKSITFGGERTKIGRGGVLAILRLLETNETIIELVISGDKSLRRDDIIRIFASLERNVTLKRLSLKGCKGVEGDLVLQAIINVLQVNPWIEEIDLSNTPLQASGKAAPIYEKLGLNASPVQEHVVLANLPLSMPTCCRVFVCGQQYAGKNTLCDSIYYNMSGIRLPYMDKVRSLVEPIEQIARSASKIKITTIQENDAKISIWNLSCNHDYLGLLDQLFPGYQNVSFFLIVASLIRTSNNRDPKTPQEIEQELVMWLKSINSCLTRLASSHSALIPHVTIVLTHSDKISQQPETLHPIASVIQKLREDFKEHIEIFATVFTVDARSTANISRLVHHVRKTAKTILQRAPLVYQLCNELINILRDWRSRNSNKPVMKWNEFCELCQMKVAVLRLRSRLGNVEKVNIQRREAARSLHKMGEIIFFEEIGFLILDCEWFCRDVLVTDSAQFFKGGAERKGGKPNNGFISRKEMEEILIKAARFRIGTGFILEANDLINMMVKLELCYEQEPAGHPSSMLLVPLFLEECIARSQSWDIISSECVYVGRRLECGDTRHMCLPSTFFPRLQVQLHNKLMQSVNQQGPVVYRLEKNLIYLKMNGIHIRIEIGVQPYYYIDVLACSVKNITEIIRLFRELIIPSVLKLCSPKIVLNESIIRPDCIKYLTPHRFRNTQHVSLQHLIEILLSLPADGMYNYQHTWNPVENVLNSGFDYARDLLSDDEFLQVVNRRYHDLHHLAVELAVPIIPHDSKEEEEEEENEKDKRVEPSISGIAKGVEIVLNRLRSIEHEIRDLKQEIQGLRYYEHRLLAELHKKVEYVVNYHTQLEERKVPHMFYFVQLDSSSERRLVTRIVPGMRTLRLHMLCEFRREMHVVDGQLGCNLIQVDNHTVQCLLPYLNGFMKLVTLALKIGVHFVAGMGEMIPDLTREVARLLEPSVSTLYGATAITATALGAARAFGRSRNRNEIGEDHVRSARQWLIDFLKSQGVITGTHIAQRFGLWRVRYCDDGNVAWVCARHLNNNANQISQMPL